MNEFKILLAGSALALGLAGTPAFSADVETPQIHRSGAISYVSGGVSEEDRSVLAPMTRDFNLKLVFATSGGEYLSDTDVVVTTGRGQPVIEAKSEGPWFFARLPNGQYVVTATANGRAQRRTIAVGPSGLRTMDFRWSALDGNGISRR